MTILSGFLFVDKPLNLTSASVVNIIKKQLKPFKVKVGHGGTLDPLATGLLPIAIGEATKILDYSIKATKQYKFTIQFGVQTNTYDLEGEVIEKNNFMPCKQSLMQAINQFTGKQMQTPPVFSAIKINGVRSYKLARENIAVELKQRAVEIFNLQLTNYNLTSKQATFIATVSSGTYIRTLAVDIAKSVNAIGCVCVLQRTAVGDISLQKKENLLINNILLYNVVSCLNTCLVGIENMLDDILAINLTLQQKQLLLNGNINFLTNNYTAGNYKAVFNNQPVALLQFNNGWKIIRVLQNYTNKINITNGVYDVIK